MVPNWPQEMSPAIRRYRFRVGKEDFLNLSLNLNLKLNLNIYEILNIIVLPERHLFVILPDILNQVNF